MNDVLCDIWGNLVCVGLFMVMLVELMYCCFLVCFYCLNLVELVWVQIEFFVEEWGDVFWQVVDLGVLQVYLLGGEFVLCWDLMQIVIMVWDVGLYVNLIILGIGLIQVWLVELDGVVDYVQLLLQGIDVEMVDWISGYGGSFVCKMQVVEWVGQIGFFMMLNVVVYCQNFDCLFEMIDLVEWLGCCWIEVVIVQFYGWVDLNCCLLMFMLVQVQCVCDVVNEVRQWLCGIMVIDYVFVDYYVVFFKVCMGGWVSIGINIVFDGVVLFCYVVQIIKGLEFQIVCEVCFVDIWCDSFVFNVFCGIVWLFEFCVGCDWCEIDFGGCCCQVMVMVGDVIVIDFVCLWFLFNVWLCVEVEVDVVSDDIVLVYWCMVKERWI